MVWSDPKQDCRTTSCVFGDWPLSCAEGVRSWLWYFPTRSWSAIFLRLCRTCGIEGCSENIVENYRCYNFPVEVCKENFHSMQMKSLNCTNGQHDPTTKWLFLWRYFFISCDLIIQWSNLCDSFGSWQRKFFPIWKGKESLKKGCYYIWMQANIFCIQKM